MDNKDKKTGLPELLGAAWPDEDFSCDEAVVEKVAGLIEESRTTKKRCEALEEEITAFNQLVTEEAYRIKKEREDYESNYAATLEAVSGLDDDPLWDNDLLRQTLDELKAISDDCTRGIVDPANLRRLLLGSRYDKDVSEAAVEGELRGRNAKIEERFRTEHPYGDGLPSFGGCNIGPSRPSASCLGALSRYGAGSTDIWERGKKK